MSLPFAYVDTSVFIKRFVEEVGTDEIEDFIAEGKFKLVISSLSIVEIKSVLKRKILQNEISQETATSIKDHVNFEITSQSLAFETMDASTFERTGQLIDRLKSQLGALDALHLACAINSGCQLMVSADKQLLRASSEAGLAILEINKH